MAIPLPKVGGNFKPAPAGSWPATCFRLIDLGTQETDFQGKKDHKHQVIISWELHGDEDAMYTDDKGVKRPVTFHRKYTWSSHKKATLRQHLEAWRGAAFTEEDFRTFDVSKLVGQPCLLSIKHEARDGQTFANLSGISRLPKGMAPGVLENKKKIIWIDEHLKPEQLEGLSDNVVGKIKSSPEYQHFLGTAKEPEKEDDDFVTGAQWDDEIPF